MARLNEIARINPGLERRPANDDVQVTFVPMRAIAPEGGGLFRPEVRSFSDVKKGYTGFLSGDVIMAKITPCMENGKTTVVPDVPGRVCFGSTEFHVLRPELGVLSRWIARYLLQHDVRRAAQREMTGGVGQMRVPTAFLEGVKIPLAPTAEQSRIADMLDELFSDLDAGVAALERVRTKLKLYRASVLKAAVEGQLTAEWRAQHPHTESASELLKRILVERRRQWEKGQLSRFKAKGQEPPKDWRAKYREPVSPTITNLPTPSEGWRWASFDQIGEIQGGLQKSPSRAPRKTHYPYLRVANVHRGSLDLTELLRFELTEAELERLRLNEGDILIVEGNGSRGEIGRCALWRGEVADCVHQNHIIRARPFRGVVPKYVDIFLNSPVGQAAIQEAATSTSGLYTLSISKIQRLPFAMPPSAEQEAIVDILEDHLSILDHLERDLDRRVKSPEALRQAILSQAFAGQLIAQDSNDEPASELLKRIALEREGRARRTAEVKARRSSHKSSRQRQRRHRRSD